jgi:hypothetical protein
VIENLPGMNEAMGMPTPHKPKKKKKWKIVCSIIYLYFVYNEGKISKYKTTIGCLFRETFYMKFAFFMYL